MSERPITKFNSDTELQASLDEWQARLGLSDWIITAELVDTIDEDDCAGGICDWLEIQKVARIRIAKNTCTFKLKGKDIGKAPAELLLVHELLHCVIVTPTPCAGGEKFETVMTDAYFHSVVEQMAKALIMAKYNITLDWFKAGDEM